MVNSRNILVGSTLTIAFTAIFAYMKKNNLTANDISLVDACWESNADPHFHGSLNETCTDLQKEGLDWDTQVPCYRGFKEDQYYYTPREMWGISTLSRGTKGDKNGFSMENRELEDAMFRCPLVLQDPDFDPSIPETAPAAVTEERANWWGPPPPPVCDRSDVDSAGHGNYKACSNSLAFDSTDEAECSGRHHAKSAENDSDGGDESDVPFCACQWWNRDTGGEHWLNRGCIRHDMCLEGWGDYTDTEHGGDACCDSMLKSAANHCNNWSVDCDDSKWQASKVAKSMWFAGHDDTGCTTYTSNSARFCSGSECGRQSTTLSLISGLSYYYYYFWG